jgi:Tfp pilus assembly protein PilF
VAVILDGGVQRAGDHVRINVQLIDTTTDEHIWAQTYDKELSIENLFAVQSQVTREIVTALHGALSEAEDLALQKNPTTSMEAYANYVLGRKELAKRTSRSVPLAKEYFEKAIELDPEYALAYVGVADANALYPQYLGIDWRETVEARQAAIDRALRINPAAGEAYANLAHLQWFQENSADSEQNFLRAILLSPNYATSYHWYSLFLSYSGRHQEAETQIRKAVELSPLEPVLVTNLAESLMSSGRYEEAESVLLANIASSQSFPGNYETLRRLRLKDGRLGEAQQLL